ncbi:Rtf2 RING-finger-domain-containing protein [Bipolaris maydis]|nr:Rtf2 RING-finger-domain-containing protein [Bipolaris maydis]
MDALWGVAGKIAESGPASANAITYITIINAIRQSLLINAPKGENEVETAARKERGIIEARRMWEDIIGRWRNADLVIDEELVCAMGRLLLVGSRPRDWDDVLSLVEQTMDIPRLVPRLGTADRQKAGFPHLRAPNVPPQYRVDDEHLSPDNTPARGDEFLPLKPKGALPHSLVYVWPGNNTLSIIQEACQKIVATKAAQEYWDLLTDPRTYKIVPDRNNLHMRLRNLRLNRASADAVRLLQEDMIGKEIEPRPGTFRIAMSACVRDKNNHNSLKHAGQILNMMFKTLEDADPKTITMYAELATSFPLAKGSDLVDALTVLDPIAKNIRLQLGVGGRERRYKKVAGPQYLEGEERQDAITALRKIHGVYDKLLFSNLIAEEMKAPFKAERARLSAFIQRILFKDGHSISKRNVEETTASEEEASPENLQGESDQGETGVEEAMDGTNREADTAKDESLIFSAQPTTMGNDGGSIPKRRELVKEAAKALTTAQIKEAQTEQQEYAWSTDPLTRKPLARPVVSDAAGILYNKDSIIEYLLKDDSDVEKAEMKKIGGVKNSELGTFGDRVKGLKDVVEVKFEIDTAAESGASEKWKCPITGERLGVGSKAVYIVPCGHAFAGSVMKEISEKACLTCNEPYAENDIVPILPTAPTDIARLNLRLKTLKEKGLTHTLKKAPGSKKKRKHAAADGPTSSDTQTTTATTKPSSSSDEDKKAKSKENGTTAKAVSVTSDGIKNSATASLTRKVLQEQEERNKRRKMAQNDNVNSLFSNKEHKAAAGNSADFMTRGFSIGKK